MENKLLGLLDYFCKCNEPETLKWGWGEGLILYALMKYDEFYKTDHFFSYVKRFYEYHLVNKYEINSSDTLCPCLASLELYKITKEDKYKSICDNGVSYINNSKKIVDGIPNHFGFGKSSKYPQSIWVDSLVMFSIFTSEYALTFNDSKMMEYASNNPKVFKDHLQNKNDLWHHSYWTSTNSPYPKNLFWGRGNGWVVLAYPIIGENCNITTDLKDDYKRTIDSMIKYQCKDGSFRTLLNRFESFKETSATILFAGGLYKAISTNMIDQSYKKYADKAFNYTLSKLKYKGDKVLLNGISKPTIPRDHRPYIWYMKMTSLPNLSYGVASFVLASIYKEQLECSKSEH